MYSNNFEEVIPFYNPYEDEMKKFKLATILLSFRLNEDIISSFFSFYNKNIIRNYLKNILINYISLNRDTNNYDLMIIINNYLNKLSYNHLYMIINDYGINKATYLYNNREKDFFEIMNDEIFNNHDNKDEIKKLYKLYDEKLNTITGPKTMEFKMVELIIMEDIRLKFN